MRRMLPLAALLLGLAGYWTPWLTHPVAALRLNGYELSEWVTFLPGVRDGSLPLSRLLFLLPLAALALQCAVAATRGQWSANRRREPTLLPDVAPGWGWPVIVAGLVCAFVVFPPYPYLLTAYADPEFQGQLFVAGLTLLVFLAALYLPSHLKDVLQIAAAVVGGGLALWALWVLRPAASSVLNAAWPIGLGWPLTLLGFAGLAWAGVGQLFGPRD